MIKWTDANGQTHIADEKIYSRSQLLEMIRPKGEWICITKSTFPQYQPDEYKCDQCNKLCHIKYYFCPFCGAKMKVGEDNE